MDGHVTLRRYLDPIEAQMDRARLASEGIPARVIEPTAFNPLYTAAAGGVTLDVRAGDATRAELILNDVAVERPHGYRVAAGQAGEEEEDPDAVRCPACESEYTSFGRAGLRGLLGPRRWRCDRCEHVWDDPSEGPKSITRLGPGDPRPVFRLRRANRGTGMFLGLGAAVLLLLATLILPPYAGETMAMLAFAAPIIGWFAGGRIAVDLCSEPRCRARLLPAAETCPACKGSIAGRVRSAAEHHSAAAAFRRELLVLHEKDERNANKAKKAQRKLR